MITEQIFYGVRCDRCRDEYESSGDYSYMTDKGEIEEAAESDEWLKIDGRHYCPDCYEEDPLKNEYDDDGELRLRSCGAKSLEVIKKQRMFDNLKCRLGFHKPAQYHQTFKHKCRTTNKGRSKKRWRTWIKEIVSVTYCERCGKTLRTKRRWRWR